MTTYQCSACGKGFRLQNALLHHIATKHGGQAKVLQVGEGGKVIGEASTPAGKAGSEAAAASKPPPTPTAATPVAVPLSASRPESVPVAPATAAPPTTAAAPAATAPSSTPSAADDKKLYVCTICQKVFRLEAALVHHYQAKHGIEMPQPGAASAATGSSSSTATSSSAAAGAAAAKPSEGLGGGSWAASVAQSSSSSDGGATAESPSSTTQYVHDEGSALPTAAQYHLDVAPNAPEEADVAAHWRCVNHIVLSGVVSSIQEGYVFQDRVLQFHLATDFDNPSPGDPDKDFHTVRVYDEQHIAGIRQMVQEGQSVLVSGRLRLVPQFETTTNKYYHFPVVMVHPGTGVVTAA